MSFLYPSILWALLLIAIPVIIHLFNFRRAKRISFPSIRFLKELQERKASRSRLRHLLSLLLRCLAIAAVVFAFAQPGAVSENPSSGRQVSIYLDNSLSMQSESREGELFSLAKESARGIVRTFRAGDEFQILSNEFYGKSQRLLSQEEALLAIDEIDMSTRARDLRSILQRQKEALRDAQGNGTRVVLSDFQEILNLDNEFEEDSNLNTILGKLNSTQPSNIFIDSAWFETPLQQAGQQSRLIFSLVNSGEKEAENVRVSLKLNGNQKAISNIDVGAGSKVLDTMLFEVSQTGWIRASLELDDAPISFDDTYFMSFQVRESLPVLVISEDKVNPYLRTFFAKEEFVNADFMQLGKIDFGRLKSYDCIILDGLNTTDVALGRELSSIVSAGSSICVFPAVKDQTEGTNALLAEMGAPLLQDRRNGTYECRKLDLNDPVFKEVFESVPRNLDLPKVSAYHSMELVSGKSRTIVRLNNNDPFLISHKLGNGEVYVFTSALDPSWTSLPKHSLFVPTLYRIIILSSGDIPLTATLGSDHFIDLPMSAKEKDPVFELQSGEESFVPQVSNVGSELKMFLPNDIAKPGFYQLRNRRSSDELLGVLALNIDRKESLLNFYSDEELKEFADRQNWRLLSSDDASEIAAGIDPAKSSGYWRFFLIAALLFLLLEALVLRFMS